MMRLATRTLLLGVIAAVPLAAQRQELPARLQPATRTAIGALADSLGAAGLPAAALYDKAAEGVLKGADDAQILSVVRSLGQRLRESRVLLGAAAPADALLAASSALYAGVPATAIRRAAESRSSRPAAPSLAVTLTVLGALVSRHVPVDVAAHSIETLLSRGARDIDLQEFQRGVEGDILGGGSPTDVTNTRAASVMRALELRRPPDSH